MKRSLCAFVVVCAAVFCSDCLADDTWTINTIAYGFSGAPTVAVDINNNPIAVFTSGYANAPLYTATQTSAAYHIEQAADIYSASWPKIAVNSNNETSITFSHGSEIWYAAKGDWFDWAYWQLEGLEAGYQDISLTDNDIPHLAYVNPSSRYVEHAFFDVHSQQWQKEPLLGMGQMQTAYACIDTTGIDTILISCFNYSMAKTSCAIYANGFWNFLPVIDNGYYSDCSFTANGLPAVAYVKSRMLCYAVYINDVIGWVETPIEPATPQFKVSLAHNSTGIPGIAYTYIDKLMYATNIAGGWTTTEIDTAGYYPDLIFDRTDKPLIVYNSNDECLSLNVVKLAGIGLEPFNIADLNNDKAINFKDFAVMAENWMTILPQPDSSAGDFNRDATVDALDLKWLGCNWLHIND